MQPLPTPDSLEPFVRDIVLLEGEDEQAKSTFPFYADGFPGIIYSRSDQPFTLQPRNKLLSSFYLYGQTVEPIALEVEGPFQMILLRLYPFAVNILLGVDPKVLMDDCYDLKQVEGVDTMASVKLLDETEDIQERLEVIANYFNELVVSASFNPNHQVKLATNLILNSKGIISIKELRSRLNVAERTLERHFSQEVGVTPKQFAKMIQFSNSLNQISEKDYLLLTDVGYDSGFSDQSHFIKTFKRYTGKTPKEFQKQISA